MPGECSQKISGLSQLFEMSFQFTLLFFFFPENMPYYENTLLPLVLPNMKSIFHTENYYYKCLQKQMKVQKVRKGGKIPLPFPSTTHLKFKKQQRSVNYQFFIITTEEFQIHNFKCSILAILLFYLTTFGNQCRNKLRLHEKYQITFCLNIVQHKERGSKRKEAIMLLYFSVCHILLIYFLEDYQINKPSQQI